MSKNSSFFEQQRFRQWWLILLMIGVNLMVIISFFKTFNSQETDEIPFLVSMIPLIAPVFVLLVSIWLFALRLDVEISEEGIYWRFFLLEFKPNYLPWEEVANYEVTKYNPLIYGGWGLHKGRIKIVSIKGINIGTRINEGRSIGNWIHPRMRSTTTYNVSGNIGLILDLTNGKRILIGTQQPDELIKVLNQIHDQRNKK